MEKRMGTVSRSVKETNSASIKKTQAQIIEENIGQISALLTEVEIFFSRPGATLEVYQKVVGFLIDLRILLHRLANSGALSAELKELAFSAKCLSERCFALEGKIKEMRNDAGGGDKVAL